jgi:hypothetical protein
VADRLSGNRQRCSGRAPTSCRMRAINESPLLELPRMKGLAIVTRVPFVTRGVRNARAGWLWSRLPVKKSALREGQISGACPPS